MKNTENCIRHYFEDGILENVAIRVGKADNVLFDIYQSKNDFVDECTLFDIASVTKIVATTSLALIALEQDLLSLDDKVGDYLQCPKDKDSLTIRHLLTHMIGIGYKDLRQDGYTYDNIEDYILHLPSDIPIGTNVLYSCSGFILLGKILEKVYGNKLNEVFQEKVAKPLKMFDTTYLPDKDNHFVNSNIPEEERGVVNCHNGRFLGGVTGQAGVFSNVADLTKYVGMLLQHGAPLIGREWFDKAIQNYTPGMNEARGLGFMYVDENYMQTGDLFPTGSIGHCGHTGQSVFVDLKSGLYVIILSDATISTVKKYGNEHYGEVMRMRRDIHNAIKEDLENYY